MAKILNVEWLKYMGKEKAGVAGQQMRRVKNVERDLIEIIKYGTKIFTEPDLDKKSNSKISPYVYVSALDNILTEMKGWRIFDRFGFNLPKTTTTTEEKVVFQCDKWLYQPAIKDWLNQDTAEMLSGYNPSQELVDILKHKLDLQSE
ncbi:hypothetical protein [Reichenbachiella sp.]|uniref:hypothetical protein n=1 Tax=Reichenbachiella sp. TaxID=2184521 RepID=UPI003298883C